MQTLPVCFGCLVHQAVSAMDAAGVDQETQIQTIKKVLHTLEETDDSITPPEIAGLTNRIIMDLVGIDDLYKEVKKKSHSLAMGYLKDLRQLLEEGKDQLVQGLKISAAGNIIDVVHVGEYNLWNEVKTSVNQELLGDSIETFRKRLNNSPFFFFFADNVGETIFDRVFIETLDIPVIYAVKSGPILNDATLEDALEAGIDQVAEIVETGSRSPGTILNQCSEEFQQLFEKSNLILSKGQANYETLDDKGDKIFFLLRVKCPILSREIDTPLGMLVMKLGASLN